jgi:hypothetical protein
MLHCREAGKVKKDESLNYYLKETGIFKDTKKKSGEGLG